jgi:hypothetical protein
MGVGRLNVWVLDAFKNGAIDNTYRFVATVQRMDGSILEWRGGRYQIKDGTWHQTLGDPHGPKPGTLGYYDGVPGTGDPGHIILEAPPGQYMVCASVHIWLGFPSGRRVLLGNLVTHKAIVDIDADQDQSVTLYQPTGFHCGIVVHDLLLPVLAGRHVLEPVEIERAREVLHALTDQLASSESDRHEAQIVKTMVNRLLADQKCEKHEEECDEPKKAQE